jgi:hypothetical protein
MAEEVLNNIHQQDHQTKSNLVSQMANEIKEKLEKAGFLIETNIGIGQFKMDLAIYNDQTKTYDLGIICDLTNETDSLARKELYHQEKFLRARGWQVKRVFQMHWYEDERKVIREIKKMVKKA